MYYLPIAHAYNVDTPFWEFVFCYGSRERNFVLTADEFIIDERTLMDQKTFRQYLSDACKSGVLQIVDQEAITKNPSDFYELDVLEEMEEHTNKYLHLEIGADPTNSVPKTDGFIDNDWLIKLMSMEPFGERALWLLNCLILIRWREINYTSFLDLIDSLMTHSFSYELADLQKSLSDIRGKATENPKVPLQLLYKLRILDPVDSEIFEHPTRGQKWEFTVNMAIFQQEAYREVTTPFAVFQTLNIFSQVLYRQYKNQCRLLSCESITSVVTFTLSLDQVIEKVERILSQEKLIAKRSPKLDDLIAGFCGKMENYGLVRMLPEHKIQIIDSSLGDPDIIEPIIHSVMECSLAKQKRRRLAPSMSALAKYRDEELAKLILEIGEKYSIPSSSCTELFLYLQAHLYSLPRERFFDFMNYCEKYQYVLRSALGFQEVLDGFNNIYKSSRKLPKPTKKIQKEVKMNLAYKEVELDFPLPIKSIGWVRFRRLLSVTSGESLKSFEGMPLTIEVVDTNKASIYQETIYLLNFDKEELPPVLDFADRLREGSSPWTIRFSLANAAPQLIITLVLEMA